MCATASSPSPPSNATSLRRRGCFDYFVQLCERLAASMIHDPERLSIVVRAW
jgi:hypothetical protein